MLDWIPLHTRHGYKLYNSRLTFMFYLNCSYLYLKDKFSVYEKGLFDSPIDL